jgi:DNA-binding XRE family transcriptional regulator
MKRRIKSKVGALREQAGLTQVQLAAFIGVTPNTIQNWEKDEGLDQLERYLKLAKILGCEVQDLVTYTETDEHNDQNTIGFSLDDLRELRTRWNLKSPNSSQAETSTKKEKSTNEATSRNKIKNKGSS